MLIFTVNHAQLNRLAELEAQVVLVNRMALLNIAQGERSSGIKLEELTSLRAQLNRFQLSCRMEVRAAPAAPGPGGRGQFEQLPPPPAPEEEAAAREVPDPVAPRRSRRRTCS